MSLRSIALVMGGTAIGGYVEISRGSTVLDSHGAQITAITPAILIGCGFWSIFHGFTVGRARAKYAELARKDGEKEVDERYLLPNLYAQGTSKHARAFNCVQRSHQHIFETFTTAMVGGLIGAVTFPICTSLSTLMYAVGRYYLSRGYAETEGDASKRYKYPVAKFMWFGLLGNITLGALSCCMVASGKNKLN